MKVEVKSSHEGKDHYATGLENGSEKNLVLGFFFKT